MGLLERKKRIQTLGQLLRVVATLLVVGVATLMALSLFNVDIRPILTGAGIAGLAVGFGAQNLVRDVIAGFFLILEDQVRLGDVVSINGKSGLVEAIRLRTIALRGQDGTVHVIPNGVINELSNMTKDYSYAVLDIGIPYEENVDEVEDILRSVANELRSDPVHGPNILEPLEVLGVEAFGESSVLLRVRIKTVPIQQWNMGRELRRRIKIAFEKRGVQFPPRPVTVRLKTRPADVRRRRSLRRRESLNGRLFHRHLSVLRRGSRDLHRARRARHVRPGLRGVLQSVARPRLSRRWRALRRSQASRRFRVESRHDSRRSSRRSWSRCSRSGHPQRNRRVACRTRASTRSARPASS